MDRDSIVICFETDNLATDWKQIQVVYDNFDISFLEYHPELDFEKKMKKFMVISNRHAEITWQRIILCTESKIVCFYMW